MKEWIYEILEFIGCPICSFQFSAVTRLTFAAVCGGIIGLERGWKGRPAGMKTFSLVCIGATLAMITNEYIAIYIAGGSGDAARMAAQVISGIGFLGAGTIMVTGANQIKGLTTAAALWVTASIGITIGCGFYFGAIVGSLVVYLSSAVFHAFEKLNMSSSRYMKVCIEGLDEKFMINLLDYFDEKRIHVKSLTRRSEYKWYKKDICVIIELDFGKRCSHKQLINDIEKLNGLRYIEEI